MEDAEFEILKSYFVFHDKELLKSVWSLGDASRAGSTLPETLSYASRTGMFGLDGAANIELADTSKGPFWPKFLEGNEASSEGGFCDQKHPLHER